jgi:hypothetical protein
MSVILASSFGYSFSRSEEAAGLTKWAETAKATGNKVAVVLVNPDGVTEEAFNDLGARTFLVRLPMSKIKIHNERFIFQHMTLKKHYSEEKYAVITDIRDVYFQSDPHEWLDQNLGEARIACSSEEILYKDEEWGSGNMKRSFPFVHQDYADKPIINVGVLGGHTRDSADLCLLLHSMSSHNPFDWAADQAAFNLLCNMPMFDYTLKKCRLEDGWAVHLGVMGHTRHEDQFKCKRLAEPPIFEGGVYKTAQGKDICIVHQADRVVR